MKSQRAILRTMNVRINFSPNNKTYATETTTTKKRTMVIYTLTILPLNSAWVVSNLSELCEWTTAIITIMAPYQGSPPLCYCYVINSASCPSSHNGCVNTRVMEVQQHRNVLQQRARELAGLLDQFLFAHLPCCHITMVAIFKTIL